MESLTKYLITGGSGLLGKELQKHLHGYFPPHSILDITDGLFLKGWDVVVHAAGYTKVDQAEKDSMSCIKANVEGTFKMLETYKDYPFVFISTEHVNAEGVYFESKRIAEMLVRRLGKPYLIIRTLFKPTPYPFDTAWIDQMTQGDYVDVIAPLIAQEITEWDKKTSKTVYVGTGRKSMYELALRTNPNVKPTLVSEYKGLARPHDYI